MAMTIHHTAYTYVTTGEGKSGDLPTMLETKAQEVYEPRNVSVSAPEDETKGNQGSPKGSAVSQKLIEAWEPPTYKILYTINISYAPLLVIRGNTYQVEAVWIAFTWDYVDQEWIAFSQLLVRRKLGEGWSNQTTLNIEKMKDQPKWVSDIIDRAMPRSTH